MIISISGLPGSGKSTAAKIVAGKLGFERIYMGGILRKIAEQKGITILELMKQAETDGSIDEEADKMVTNLGNSKDNFVIESRTAFYFIPESLKVFIKVDLREGAKRIFKDLEKGERSEEEKADSADNLYEKLKERTEVDRGRYQKYYGIDFTDEDNYDLVINSTYFSSEEVVEKIMAEAGRIKEQEEQTADKLYN